MKFITQIGSFLAMIIGFTTSILSNILPFIDSGIVSVTGLIGLAGGIVWYRISINKYKQGKLALKNEELDNQMKKKQLKKLDNDS